MGDRTWVELTYKKCDKDKIFNLLGNEYRPGPTMENPDLYETAYYSEENYGGSDIADTLRDHGLTYMLHHGMGDSYSGGVTLSFFGREHYQELDFNGNYYITVNDDGDINESELKNVRIACLLKKMIWAYFKGEKNPEIAVNLASIRFTGDILPPKGYHDTSNCV